MRLTDITQKTFAALQKFWADFRYHCWYIHNGGWEVVFEQERAANLLTAAKALRTAQKEYMIARSSPEYTQEQKDMMGLQVGERSKELDKAIAEYEAKYTVKKFKDEK